MFGTEESKSWALAGESSSPIAAATLKGIHGRNAANTDLSKDEAGNGWRGRLRRMIAPQARKGTAPEQKRTPASGAERSFTDAY
jgi:hypothetical protein